MPVFVPEGFHVVEYVKSFACLGVAPMQHPLIVEVRLVPGVLQRADPPSRLDLNHQSSMQRACSQAYRLWRVLLLHPKEVQQVGGLIL